MAKHNNSIKPLSLTIGTAFVASLAASPVYATGTSPFGLTELNGGYHQLAEKEGSCGGTKMPEKQTKEASCGAEKMKAEKEARHGTDKKKEMKEGSCGGSK